MMSPRALGHVERSGDSAAEGSFGATGGSAAITANRLDSSGLVPIDSKADGRSEML